jgi:hypothetical protein
MLARASLRQQDATLRVAQNAGDYMEWLAHRHRKRFAAFALRMLAQAQS